MSRMIGRFGRMGAGFGRAGNTSSASSVANPTLLLDANFADESYTLDGESVTLAEVFPTITPFPFGAPQDDDGELIPGVGWQVEKRIGETGSTGSWGPGVLFYFAPEILAAVNTSQGFTLVVDYAFTDQVNGTTAHYAQNYNLEMYDNQFAYHYLMVWGGAHSRLPTHATDPSDFHVGAYTYDYDLSAGDEGLSYHYVTDGDHFSGTGIHTVVPGVIRNYFASAPGDAQEGLTPVVPFPHPNSDTLIFSMRAAAHQGTEADKANVGCKTTIKRIRIYTPGQALGWVPPIAVSDFKAGYYETDGVEVAFADQWEGDDWYWGSDAPDIVPGVGATFTGTQFQGRALRDKGDLLSTLNITEGLTVVADVAMSRTGTLRPSIGLHCVDFDAPYDSVGLDLADDMTYFYGPASGYTGVSVAADNLVSQRVAVTITNGGLSGFSVNGGEVVADTSNEVLAPLDRFTVPLIVRNIAGTGTATMTIERLAFYRPMPLAALPGLSAL